MQYWIELLARDESDKQQKVTTQKLYSLLKLTTALVDVISQSDKVPASKSYTTVASILMNRHLPDLYAALLELAYAPTSALAQQEEDSNADSAAQQSASVPLTPGNMFATAAAAKPKQQIGLKREERDKCARMFMWLFDRSDLPRAMESLMSLLGTSSSLHPIPNWLRTICGRFLSRILLKPNGVSIVLEFTIGHVDQRKPFIHMIEMIYKVLKHFSLI